MNQQKNLNLDVCLNVLNNVCVFMTFLPVDLQQQQWQLVFQECENLFKKMEGILKKYNDYTCIFLILINLLKVSFISNAKVNVF